MNLFDRDKFRLYLDFVVNRHHVWMARQEGMPGPWSDDPIIASRKFTNVFRVLDPGSQFIFDLDDEYATERDLLMRLFLYRHTGRVEAWMYLQRQMGEEYPTVETLDYALNLWREYRDAGNPIFTPAYLVYPQSSTPGTDKLESIIRLTQRLFDPSSPEDIVEDFIGGQTQKEKFDVLRRTKGVADFMSMQILTDWGYTRFGEDMENEFVVPGPGARRGIMHLVTTPQQKDFLWFAQAELMQTEGCPVLDLGTKLRYPSIMDVQNTMCEFGKYVRFMEGGKPFTAPYSPAHPGPQPAPRTPRHWA